MKFDDDKLTEKIISGCYKVHRELGPGFSEKIYSKAIKSVFDDMKLPYNSEKEFTVKFSGKEIGTFRVDFLIASAVILEVKALQGAVPKLFESQVLSYLKAAGLKVGLLVNFGNRSCQVRRLMYDL